MAVGRQRWHSGDEYKKGLLLISATGSLYRDGIGVSSTPPGTRRSFFMPKQTKARNWLAVMYPESLPPDWREQLDKTGLEIAISPLHDKDVYTEADEKKNPANRAGTQKKPHYHAILCYSGPATYATVKAITDSLGQPAPVKCESVKGNYDYLTHKNRPEKAQYDPADIVLLNGFNIVDHAELAKSEVLRLKKELQTLIIEQNFLDYAGFLDYVMFNGTDEEYDVASSHTMLFMNYIKGRWQQAERQRQELERQLQKR